MAKETGLGWTTLSVDDSAGSVQAIKNDVNEFEFATPREEIVTTGVDKSAVERLLGLADFSATFKGTFNDAANQSHAVLKTVPSTSVARTVTLTVSGQTLANECLFTDYALTREKEGALNWEAPCVLADGAVPTWS